LGSGCVQNWINTNAPYVFGNPGYDRLLSIVNGERSKNQAKYKWISIMHYLHSIKTLIEAGAF